MTAMFNPLPNGKLIHRMELPVTQGSNIGCASVALKKQLTPVGTTTSIIPQYVKWTSEKTLFSVVEITSLEGPLGRTFSAFCGLFETFTTAPAVFLPKPLEYSRIILKPRESIRLLFFKLATSFVYKLNYSKNIDDPDLLSWFSTPSLILDAIYQQPSIVTGDYTPEMISYRDYFLEVVDQANVSISISVADFNYWLAGEFLSVNSGNDLLTWSKDRFKDIT